jgi:hypothetical protein
MQLLSFAEEDKRQENEFSRPGSTLELNPTIKVRRAYNISDMPLGDATGETKKIQAKGVYTKLSHSLLSFPPLTSIKIYQQRKSRSES